MKRSKHSLSYYRLATLDGGYIMPIGCTEVLPGDSFRHDTSVLLRCLPLVAPVMHPVDVQVHHWFVPNRLVWDGWEDFITTVDENALVPTIQLDTGSTAGVRSLAECFGVGINTTSTVTLNAMPFRAYNFIWNEFYRDQDIDTKVAQVTGNTDDDANYTPLRSRWEKDYFTTARPYPQQGSDTQVATLDLSLGKVPVSNLGAVGNAWQGAGNSVRLNDGTTTTTTTTPGQRWATTGSGLPLTYKESATNALFPDVHVDLSNVPGGAYLDINEFRRAMAHQRIREHRNRFGSRYRDYLAFLGVKPSDGRLDRPEYLGGGKQTVSFSEVLSTAETAEAPIGQLGGHGIAALRTRAYRRFFEEHGHILSFIIVRPRTVYMDNVPRNFLRRTWDDYWQKELEMMGEQPISNREIYYGATNSTDVFGYIQRYDEYRRQQSYVSGEFRTTLDYWHYARKFSSQPVLNSTFLECFPTDRVYVVQNAAEFQAMCAHRITAQRLVARRASA